MKLLQILTVVLVTSFLGVVVWMNITPGYFNNIYSCCDTFRYYEIPSTPVMLDCVPCRKLNYWEYFKNIFFLSLAPLDFNR